MAKLALVYGMRLFPSEDLGEVGEAAITLKDGRTARVTMHLIEGSKEQIEETLRQSVEAFPAADRVNVNGLVLPPHHKGGVVDGMNNQVAVAGGNVIAVELFCRTGGREGNTGEQRERQRCERDRV